MLEQEYMELITIPGACTPLAATTNVFNIQYWIAQSELIQLSKDDLTAAFNN